jgi:hypothetical protein
LVNERHSSLDNFLPQHNCNASTTLIICLIFVDDLSKKYSDACCKFDINVGKILKKLFPKMDISCRMNNGKRGTSYSGIYWKHDALI